MTQLTLQLSDEIVRQVRARAESEGMEVEEFVADLVRRDVARDPDDELRRMAALSDAEVLALADLQLHPEEDQRLSDLLDRNGEGQLEAGEQEELEHLVRLSTEGMLKKSLGWAEAVRRKLREPPL
jgi:hypothetical protein